MTPFQLGTWVLLQLLSEPAGSATLLLVGVLLAFVLEFVLAYLFYVKAFAGERRSGSKHKKRKRKMLGNANWECPILQRCLGMASGTMSEPHRGEKGQCFKQVANSRPVTYALADDLLELPSRKLVDQKFVVYLRISAYDEYTDRISNSPKRSVQNILAQAYYVKNKPQIDRRMKRLVKMWQPVLPYLFSASRTK